MQPLFKNTLLEYIKKKEKKVREEAREGDDPSVRAHLAGIPLLPGAIESNFEYEAMIGCSRRE